MAADFLKVDRTKQLGNNLVRLAEILLEARHLSSKLNATVGHSFSSTDFSMMETNFGIAAGTGANAASLVGQLDTILNTNTTVAGQARLDLLNEFCARVAGQ